jgi:hypothetical protein
MNLIGHGETDVTAVTGAGRTPGRIQLHDPRSRDYAFRSTRPISSSVTHRFDAPHVDQFYLSGCVGFAGTNMLNCAAAQRSRKQFHWIDHVRRSTRYLTNDDGLTNYHNATVNDPFDWTWPPTDEGSSALGLMKWWRAAGIIHGYEWTFDFDSFLKALETQPLLVGTNWYSDMNKPNQLGFVAPTGESLGGHEYLATGFRRVSADDDYILRFENSWGENWGLGGRFYMMSKNFERLLGEGADVARPRFL